MKSFKFLLVVSAVFLLNTVTVFANPIKPTDQLREEIVDIIGFSFLDDYEENEYSAEVLFTVNSEQELIVLSVNSESGEAEDYLRNKLNYKKVDHMPSKYGEIYLLPVKMIKE
ncbi:MAG: hypothetical protein WBV45_11480 [Lutimonas sp.]